MMPTTSSPSASFTRTVFECSINCLRYFASSNVCSGARADFPCGGVMLLLTLLLRLPVGGHSDAVFRRTGNPALDLPIIAVARGHPQIRHLYAHVERMKSLLGERNILRIEAHQILGTQFGDDIGEGFIELGAEGGHE